MPHILGADARVDGYGSGEASELRSCARAAAAAATVQGDGMSEQHIVALSGGKDSTAMALWLAENEPRQYIYVCTPTGDELPEMFAHWNKLSVLLGSKIQPVMSGHTLQGLIRSYEALPNWRQRWCTRQLKIEPYKAFLCANAPAVSYVGLRADEEDREGGVFGDIDGITRRFPLRDLGWGVREVWAYLERRGVSIPRRTDCARCFFQRLGEWWDLWKEHPDEFADAVADEEMTGHTFRSPGRDAWPTALRDLGAAFAAGRIPRDRQQLSFEREDMCRTCSL